MELNPVMEHPINPITPEWIPSPFPTSGQATIYLLEVIPVLQTMVHN